MWRFYCFALQPCFGKCCVFRAHVRFLDISEREWAAMTGIWGKVGVLPSSEWPGTSAMSARAVAVGVLAALWVCLGPRARSSAAAAFCDTGKVMDAEDEGEPRSVLFCALVHEDVLCVALCGQRPASGCSYWGLWASHLARFHSGKQKLRRMGPKLVQFSNPFGTTTVIVL